MCIFPATPAAKLMPNVMLCLPLDTVSKVKRDLDDWATQDLYKRSPGSRSGEDTPVSLLQSCEKTTRKLAVTGYKSRPDWRKARRQGSASSSGRDHRNPTGRLPPALNLGSPRTIRCRPATIHLLQWVPEAYCTIIDMKSGWLSPRTRQISKEKEDSSCLYCKLERMHYVHWCL